MPKPRVPSTPRSRTEIIASYQYGTALASPPAPPSDETAKPIGPENPDTEKDPSAPDSPVDTAIASVEAAIGKLKAAQAADPDAASDPNDKAVSDDIAALEAALQKVKADQAKDDAGDPKDEGSPSTPTKKPAETPPAAPAPAVSAAGAVPDGAQKAVSEDPEAPTDVPDNAECENTDCGHTGLAHQDTEIGKNLGPCSVQGCLCQAMESSAAKADEEDQPSEQDNPAGGQPDTSPTVDDQSNAASTQAFAGATDDEPAPTDDADGSGAAQGTTGPSQMNPAPDTDGGQNMGPAFTIPVGVIEGQPTGDGREIQAGALTWRNPPMPLMGLATSTHDPNGFDMNDPAVVIGRIDSLERVPGDGDTQVIMAKGFYLANDDGAYFADLNEQMGRLGVSADIAVDSELVTVEDVDTDGFPTQVSNALTAGTILGFTVCMFPAFAGCYIVLGDGTDQAEAKAIPQASEGASASKPPDAVTAGGQLIRFVTFAECVPCASGMDVLTAAAGPVKPPTKWFLDPCFTVGDGRLALMANGNYACPLTITEEGQIFGHIAPWGMCHVGVSGQCITAPHSKVDYAYFKRGQEVITAEGDHIRVGVITADTGHASQRHGTSPAAAMAHYDDARLQAALVSIGEDEYGIWVAGSIAPEATDAQVAKLRATSPSGDWRMQGGNLELVACLAVNEPGFPIAVVASGQVESLVAVGSAQMTRLMHPVVEEPKAQATPLRRAVLGAAKQHAMKRLRDTITT